MKVSNIVINVTIEYDFPYAVRNILIYGLFVGLVFSLSQFSYFALIYVNEFENNK
jgi:hypothetical protein